MMFGDEQVQRGQQGQTVLLALNTMQKAHFTKFSCMQEYLVEFDFH
jgi:hypothetical protein